jgi:HlyD family secretion protein
MASNPEPRRTNVLLLSGLAFAILVALVFVVRHATRERVRLHVAPVTYQDLRYTVPTNGRVELVNDYQAHTMAAGEVQEVYVDLGQKVKPGDLLVRMDTADPGARLASAKSAVSAAQLAMDDMDKGGTQDERNTYASELSRLQAQRTQDATDLATVQRLQQQGASSAAEVAAAQRRLQVDDEAIQTNRVRSTKRYSPEDRTRAEAQLADARASLAAAEANMGTVLIHSPIAGTVYSISVSPHNFVKGAEELLDVADLKHIQVRAFFDEPDVGRLKPGQPVKITWEAKPNMAWHGHVDQVPTTIVSAPPRNVGECIVSVDDADGDLTPNSDVTVAVTTSEHNHVLSIPREALRTDGAKNFVFRVVNSKLVRVAVQVDVVTLNRVQITAGLSENDIVALNANDNRELEDGLEVIPIRAP